MRWQPWTEYVLDPDKIHFLTDRADLAGWFAAMNRGPAQLGVSITDVLSADAVGLVVSEDGLPGEAVIDLAAGRVGIMSGESALDGHVSNLLAAADSRRSTSS
jgi:hypothetical protein